jgi:Tfp pilus assembly protein PilZ
VRVASIDSFRASYLRDLSQGGLFVRSQKPLPMSTRVMIELHVPNESPLPLKGEVVRVEANGFGVRFDENSEETTAHLYTLISKHSATETKTEDSSEDLKTQLLEALGNIEAYEEAMAQMRDSEMHAVARAESAESEREILANVARELTTRVNQLEAERAKVMAGVELMKARMTSMERELTTAHRSPAVATPLPQSSSDTAELKAEVAKLKYDLENSDLQRMRVELQDLLGQLEDEKLKSMAMQRALERFMTTGIPK